MVEHNPPKTDDEKPHPTDKVKKEEEKELDKTLEDTFPASDSPATY